MTTPPATHPADATSAQSSTKDDNNPMATTRIPLTLIVATTPSLGIGLKGTLPWPQLKAEMAYFARVTKRTPAQISAAAVSSKGSSLSPQINALIMGRSTYTSIPSKFRPLKARLNVVLTRAKAGSETHASLQPSQDSAAPAPKEGPLIAHSLPAALDLLAQRTDVGRVFVIGGSEIYRQALEMPNSVRILRTRVEKEFECDVFFPDVFSKDDESGWKKSGQAALNKWVGEDVPEGLQEQDGMRWEYEMWERENGSST